MRQILALIIFAMGVFTPNLFPELPATLFLCLGFAALLILFYLFRSILLISFTCGLAYGCFSAVSFSDAVLPESLNNQSFFMEGRIESTPFKSGKIWRLDFIPDLIENVPGSQPSIELNDYVPNKVRLSYYGYIEQPFVSGERLRIEAKLRRPHGLMNPGLFDYQRWLIGKGYSATGYIKHVVRRSDPQTGFSGVNRWRAKISQILNQAALPNADIQAALLVGDRSNISQQRMSLFVDTGTIHLMVISGLHVGFIAAIGFFVGRWTLSILLLTRCRVFTEINSVRYAYLASLIAGFGYALAAGFSIPTVRAVVMLSAFLLPRFFYLKTGHWWSFALALAVIALLDPLSPLQNGFWLSFGAVCLIFISLGNQPKESSIDHPTSSVRNPVLALAHIQWVFLVGFSGMVLLFQGQLNLVSFIANMIAVPLTGLIIVPLEILGLAAFQLRSDIGIFIWDMAGRVIGLELKALELLHQNVQLVLVRNPIPWYLAIFSAAAGLLIFGFRRSIYRLGAFICMLPLFVPFKLANSDHYVLELRVFDVGQGLSILVRQPGYSLLYDTGPKFGESFDSGRDVIAPSLLQLGVKQIDDLIISHPDADHIGGYAGLVKEDVSTANIWLGRQAENQPINRARECHQGIGWQKGEVRYQFIYPEFKDSDSSNISSSNIKGEEASHQTDNNRSCVLQISFGDQRILLPGDISASVEKTLVSEGPLEESMVLLIAPHHGSKTSSSELFLETTQPENVVFSSGYMNRFGHPHQIVLKRYEDFGSKLYSTASDGMIQFRWPSVEAEPEVKTEAEKRIFWWQK